MTVAVRSFARYLGTVSLKHRSGDMFPNLLIGYMLALKHRLRGSHNTEEELHDMTNTLLPQTLQIVMKVNNRPAALLRLLTEFVYDKATNGELSDHMLNPLNTHLNELFMCQTACERIVNTPMPLPYLIQIRQLVFVFCCTLPLVLNNLFTGWGSLLATFFISFGLLGIEEAGKIIENPFGDDERCGVCRVRMYVRNSGVSLELPAIVCVRVLSVFLLQGY